MASALRRASGAAGLRAGVDLNSAADFGAQICAGALFYWRRVLAAAPDAALLAWRALRARKPLAADILPSTPGSCGLFRFLRRRSSSDRHAAITMERQACR